MPRHNLEDFTVPAKRAPLPAGKPTKLDGINVSKLSEDKTKVTKTFYDKKGKEIGKIDTAFAYSESKGDKTSYYLMFATAGPAIGHILNINSMSYRPGDETKFEAGRGRKLYEFRKVSKEMFDLYLKFLQTSNEKYILQAERLVINGTPD